MGCVAGIGIGLGAWLAVRTSLTKLPQLMALFHSMVGLAAGLMSWVPSLQQCQTLGAGFALLEGTLGMVTFSGSLFSYLRLEGRFQGGLPRTWFSLLGLINLGTFLAISILFMQTLNTLWLVLACILSLGLGIL